MIALVAILAWLPCPWDSITSADDVDWYQPVEIEYVNEQTIQDIDEKIRLYEIKQRYRIMENRDD